MQEAECGEELLTLGLGINSGWRIKKRPPNEDHEEEEEEDNSFLRLLRSRDQMLIRKRRGGGCKGQLELIHSLLTSATAVNGSNTTSAVDSLIELYQTVSPAGDPIQRVAAYFADGLAARLLLTRSSPLYDRIVAAARPTAEEELSAFTHLYQASPYHQFAHFTANQAIVEAFDKDQHRRALHVIDLDVSYGFQWPSLIQSLSDQATAAKPISLRITGLGPNIDILKETEARLTSFAKSCCNLFFKFEGRLLRASSSPPKSFRDDDLKIDKSETLVVNSVFHLQSLRISAEITATLRHIHSLNPSLVVLVEREAGVAGPRSFLSRFVESLHYFAAMFDSLDDCLPADSVERLSIERDHLGKEIKNAVSTCGEYSSNKYSYKLESLKERMESNHFEGVKLSSRSVSQAKLLLKIRSHCSETDHGSGGAGGFRVFGRDDGGGLSLGWQDRLLITASAWRCARLSNGDIIQSQEPFA